MTSRIVYMHDPGVIDSAGDGALRCGGAFKRHHGAPVSTAAVTVRSICSMGTSIEFRQRS